MTPIQSIFLISAFVLSKASNEPISVAVFEEPELLISTPGNPINTPGIGLGPGLIDDLTRPDGTDIKLPSPSYLFAIAVRDKLISDYNLNISEVPNTLLPMGKGKRASQSKANTLEIFTDINILGYRPTQWATYQYSFYGRARLIDQDGKELWEKKCKVSPYTNDPTRQLDRTEFKNDDGAKLVAIMSDTINRCASSLMQQLK